MSEFDWIKDPNVVFRSYGAVAAYLNESGDLVIRQDNGMEDDALVIVAKEHVELLLLHIRDMFGLTL